jgi:acetoacetyl-CoA reductase
MRAVLPGMRARKWGRVINVGSVVAAAPGLGVASYAAAKSGLIGLTRAGAQEGAQLGITVNLLALGYFEAGMIRDVPEPMMSTVLQRTPVGRLGSVDEFTHALMFLASEEAAFVTGQTLHLNGGLYA